MTHNEKVFDEGRTVFGEAELRRMSRGQRQQLAQVLAAIDEPRLLRDPRRERRRRFWLMVVMGCCVVLAGWIVVLEFTLPNHYTTHYWRTAWVGFDAAEFLAFGLTAWSAWFERQILILCVTVTGTLLCCDAWFDLVLDLGTREFPLSVVTAAFAELPLAFMMFAAAWRLVRLSAGVVLALEGLTGPVPTLWRIPLLAEGLAATLPARYQARRSPRPSVHGHQAVPAGEPPGGSPAGENTLPAAVAQDRPGHTLGRWQ